MYMNEMVRSMVVTRRLIRANLARFAAMQTVSNDRALLPFEYLAFVLSLSILSNFIRKIYQRSRQC